MNVPAGLPITLLVVATIAMGCASPEQRQAREVEENTYRIALQRMVQGHVYEMRCEALLPLARDLLWESPYEGTDYTADGLGLRTDWLYHDDRRRSMYEVHAHRVGSERCAVQFIHRHDVGASEHRNRDVQRELELLDKVDSQRAQQLRSKARQEAREAHDETLRQLQQEGRHE